MSDFIERAGVARDKDRKYAEGNILNTPPQGSSAVEEAKLGKTMSKATSEFRDRERFQTMGEQVERVPQRAGTVEGAGSPDDSMVSEVSDGEVVDTEIKAAEI